MACFVFQTIDIGYKCVRICAGREAELKEVIRVRICDGWEAGLNGVNSIGSSTRTVKPPYSGHSI